MLLCTGASIISIGMNCEQNGITFSVAFTDLYCSKTLSRIFPFWRQDLNLNTGTPSSFPIVAVNLNLNVNLYVNANVKINANVKVNVNVNVNVNANANVNTNVSPNASINAKINSNFVRILLR